MTQPHVTRAESSDKHPYNPKFGPNDCFNSKEGNPAKFEPITREDRTAEINALVELVMNTRRDKLGN
jgi:hypothetical protein